MSSSDEPPYGEQPPYGQQPPPQPPYGDQGGQAPYGQQPYGAPPPPPSYGSPYQPYGYGAPTPTPQTSVMAIISLVTGIIGLFACCSFVFSIAAVVLGFLGKKEIDESNGAKTGRGMAMAGLILGVVGIVLGVLYIVLSVVANVAFYDYDTTY